MIILDVLNTLLLGTLVAIVVLNNNKRTPIADEQPAEQEQDIDPFDAETIAKKKAFNERIARIKDELALEHSRKMNRTTDSAKPLHPDVYNLPHDSIITPERDDVEYAD